MRDPHDDHDQPFDQGLQHDLKVLNALANRRRVLTLSLIHISEPTRPY